MAGDSLASVTDAAGTAWDLEALGQIAHIASTSTRTLEDWLAELAEYRAWCLLCDAWAGSFHDLEVRLIYARLEPWGA